MDGTFTVNSTHNANSPKVTTDRKECGLTTTIMEKKIKKNAILSKMTEQLNIIRVQAHEKYKIDDIVVETLKSTDEGVAFIVCG